MTLLKSGDGPFSLSELTALKTKTRVCGTNPSSLGPNSVNFREQIRQLWGQKSSTLGSEITEINFEVRGRPRWGRARAHCPSPAPTPFSTCREREFFIDNLLARNHFIIDMIRWTGLAQWEFEFPFPGSRTSTFLATACKF